MNGEGAKPTKGKESCVVDQLAMVAENHAKMLREKDLEIARLNELLKDEVRPSPEPASLDELLREIRACLKRLEARLGTDA